MTHEYVIAVRGVVLGTGLPGAPPTAIAWAADRVLAVGSDELVATISRGDSTFLDLAGAAVTPAPADPAAAERLVRAAVAASAGSRVDPVELLVQAGMLAAASRVEAGAPADLAVWTADPGAVPPSGRAPARILAIVRAGAFTAGDEHTGPFARLPGPASTGQGTSAGGTRAADSA